MSLIKKIILWRYNRGSWQYDVLCLLIILFIFLTPNDWFDKREKLATQTSRLIVKAGDFSPEQGEIEKRVREMSGNPNAEIIEMRERRSDAGELFYEIDIR